MKEQDFLASIEDLTGKVAVVTGGAKGIGLETSIYLATKGATVYIPSRDTESNHAGVIEVRRRVKLNLQGLSTPSTDDVVDIEKRIKFHPLDLSSMHSAWSSARDLKQKIEADEKENRLDILIANAGVSMTTLETMSPDGYDMMFAVNHLGNFAFIMGLIDLITRTAETTHDARIIYTNSNAYRKVSAPLDYQKLSTAIPDDGKTLKDIINAFSRYEESKLAAVYGALEFSLRLRKQGFENVYLNSCHPGNSINTTLGTGHQKAVNATVERIFRTTLGAVMGNSLMDSAKTQVYLAGSNYVRGEGRDGTGTHGEFWAPIFTLLTRSYTGCRSEEYTVLAKDEKEREKLWQITVEAFRKAVSDEQIESVGIVKRLIE